MKNRLFFIAIATLATFGGCKFYDNSTTLFNTYYNQKRLMTETEDEFSFTEEKRRVKPRVLVPLDSGAAFGQVANTNQLPPYIKDQMIDQAKLQPVAIKLDSVLIKGSKILKLHPKSNYIESTIFLMAKAYFYKSEWLPAEVKCSELIDKYPLGEYSPDAHLLQAKCYLIERKYALGKNMLSRTVDVAWQMKRYDILSEAFQLMAEQALFEENVEEALRPYRQAIAQCDDNEIRAKWQIEIGSILYRISQFEKAEKEFAAASEYSPDLLSEFEAALLRASCFNQMGKFEQAEPILSELERNENYKDWSQNVLAERMRMYRLQSKEKELTQAEQEAEKIPGSPALTTMYFERAMEFYKQNDYTKARVYLAKATAVKSPVQASATSYFSLLNTIEDRHAKATRTSEQITKFPASDSLKVEWSSAMFDIGRAHEKLGHPDSTLKYFQAAMDSCPNKSKEKARFIYGVVRMQAATQPEVADSLMEVLALDYSTTDFGIEARKKLGFTEAVVVDTIADLFQSGSKFRAIGDHENAVRQFVKLADKYRTSVYAPRSLYNVGWIYERKLLLKDSAIYYYKLLLERYPTSIYAKDISPSLSFYDAYQVSKSNTDSVAPWQRPKSMMSDSAALYNVQQPQDLPVDLPPKQDTRPSIKSDGTVTLPAVDKVPVDAKIDVSKIKLSLPFGLEKSVPELPFMKSDTTKTDTTEKKVKP